MHITELVLQSLAETAAPRKPEDGKAVKVDDRVDLLRQIRSGLESMMCHAFDHALSLLLDEILQMEASFMGEEGQP